MNIIGTNIISSLGFTTEENFANVKRGISGIRHYNAGVFDLQEAFMASLIDKERLNDCFSDIPYFKNEHLTELEKAAILSVYEANKQANIDLSSEKTVFILSTTKGNVHLLGSSCNYEFDPQSPLFLWKTAKLIAGAFKNPNMPIVVSNACISGACAQIAAMRELESGKYDNAVVIGADFLSKFIISGFQSFKALSPELCKPFDKDCCGLNLGEAAATLIMKNEELGMKNEELRMKNEKLSMKNELNFSLKSGCIRNDANHISAPSRVGEGSYRALKNILQDIDKEDIAFINAHGTATPYNDAMEKQAITRAGLQEVPVNSLKAFFGHTLGAAGVLESIISMRALSENLVLKSLNFSEQNTDNQINISTKNQPTGKKYFIKMLSGFGGCNAALLFEKLEIES